ncbi:MAG: FlgD immunoglobulin-like domain containing protein [bacterium]|nr:FlgD immunoglobulin-like domain containing protein [bacterium]
MKMLLSKGMLLLFAIAVMTGGGTGRASTPDQTFLWNRLDQLVVTGQYVVGCSQRGIVVSKYDSDKRLYFQVGQLFETMNPERMKRFGNYLVVKEYGGELLYFDLSRLPSVSLLGRVNVESDFADFAMIGEDLVVSRWFDGITRYDLIDHTTARFADSSLKGILVTQLEVEDNQLFVLDEYNGILRYDVSAPNQLGFVDYLWVPHRPSSFLKFESSFAVSLSNDGLMFGQFGFPGSIYDSLMELPSARSLYQTERQIIQVTDRSLLLIDKSNFSISDTISLEQVSIFGDMVTIENSPNLVLPSTVGGFMLFDLEGSARPTQGYARPGPISKLYLYGNQVVTGGEANPLDAYAVSNLSPPEKDTTISPELNTVSDFVRTNDSLIVFYSYPINSLVLYSGLADPDYPLFLESRYPTDSIGFSRLYLSELSATDSLRFLLIAKENFFEAYAFSNSGQVQYIQRWSYVGRIESFAVDGRNLYTVTSKGTMWVHQIRDDLSRALLTTTSVFRNTSELFVRSGKLWVIQDRTITWLNVDDPSSPFVETTLDLNLAVSDVKFFGDSLYTVGYEGIGIYALEEDRPKLVWSNDWPGVMIDVDSNLMVVSDGSAIDLFKHPSWREELPEPPPSLPSTFILKPNYPNPFNAATRIRFDLAIATPIELSVYNGLGQKVAILASGLFPMGTHEVEWDGRNRDGQSVASGVYFYRLKVGQEQASRKMLYLK